MNILFQILKDASSTEFGKMHGFADIHTLKEYQKEVPISVYDDYATYIYRMSIKGEKNLLTPYPVIRWITFLGLYRYLTRDVVRGRKNGDEKVVPEFAYKADQVADLVGENFNAQEITSAIRQWAKERELDVIGVTMYQKEEPGSRSYVILPEICNLDYSMDIEYAQRALDCSLGEVNAAYKKMREQGKIGQCHIYFLQKGTFEAFRAQKRNKGMTEEFIDVPVVIHNEVTKRYFISMIDECI